MPKTKVIPRVICKSATMSIMYASLLCSYLHPCLAQTTNTPPTPAAPTSLPKFTVISVKPDLRNDGRWRMDFTADGYSALGIDIDKLIKEAYRIFDGTHIFGEPKWATSQLYDIKAKLDDADVATLQSLDEEQRSQMLQSILAERFNFVARHETRDAPIYLLVVDKNGPKLHPSVHDSEWANRPKGMGGLITRSRPGQLTAEWMSMASLAEYLSSYIADRKVVDGTGLTGHYDLSLDWAPQHRSSPGASASAPDTGTLPEAPSGPSIFTAVREQLGLKLDPQKGSIDVLVIDHIDQPAAN